MINPVFNKQKNREPIYGGKFYPATEQALKSQLAELFAVEAKQFGGRNNPLALISPHAGYVFSGEVAAAAFSQISGKANYKRVFVLASSHRFLFGGAAVFDTGNYETPLGEIKTDRKLAAQLVSEHKQFIRHPEAHYDEHSLEVQLPFLQYKLGSDFHLVPIILGTDNPSDCKSIARALEPFFSPENLFVISTDFSHYPCGEDAVKNDMLTAKAICSNNPEELILQLKKNKKKNIAHLATSLCGWTSVLTLLYLTRNKNLEYNKIAYRNSGDSVPYGDNNRVVGYWAIAVFDKNPAFSLTREEQAEMLEKARNSIGKYLETGRQGAPEPPKTIGILKKQAGVFVSVYVNGELRGCIGNFAREETLNDMVQHIAVSAACDYRFENLQTDELKDMELEISVLSPLRKIDSIEEIELGKHGIYIKKGLNSGTFLPQVAKKTGWSLEEFLGHCARDKAGLNWNDWREAEIFIFEAFIFKG